MTKFEKQISHGMDCLRLSQTCYLIRNIFFLVVDNTEYRKGGKPGTRVFRIGGKHSPLQQKLCVPFRSGIL